MTTTPAVSNLRPLEASSSFITSAHTICCGFAAGFRVCSVPRLPRCTYLYVPGDNNSNRPRTPKSMPPTSDPYSDCIHVSIATEAYCLTLSIWIGTHVPVATEVYCLKLSTTALQPSSSPPVSLCLPGSFGFFPLCAGSAPAPGISPAPLLCGLQ